MDLDLTLRAGAFLRRRAARLRTADSVPKTLEGLFLQDDMSVANGPGSTVRADINSQLQALVTMNGGSSAPATAWANMLWADTTNTLAKKRNNANSTWNTFADLDFLHWLLSDGTVGNPAYSFSGDVDTGLYRIGANNIGVACNGAKVLDIGTTGLAVTGAASAGTLAATQANTGSLNVGNHSTWYGSGSSALFYSDGGGGGGAAFEALQKGSGASTYVGALWNAATAGDNAFLGFYTEDPSATIRGGIDFNRGGTAVRYNTTSDARLKIDHGAATRDPAWIGSVAATIRDVEWKETAARVVATIAQSLFAVEPDAVKKGDDAAELQYDQSGRCTSDIWAVDPSKLIYKLILEVASLRSRVDAI